MKKMKNFAQISELRMNTIEYVKSLNKLESDNAYKYMLYHYYDAEPCNIWVKTKIEPAVFELLLAYILFEASEINECYSLGQEEIALPVLSDLYGVDLIKNTGHSQSIDLYYTWEKYCGLFNEVMSIKLFKRDELKGKLTDIINGE